MRRLFFISNICFLLLAVGGCSLFGKKDEDETAGWTAEKIYYEANKRLKGNYYDGAIKYYEALQANYPFGAYAQQAQIELCYAYYKVEKPAEALASCERFLKLYPQHPHTDYVYYLKGLVNFNSGKGLTSRFLPRDDTQRDPGAALQSFNDFDELVRRYPDSMYVEDARLRMVYLRNLLAQHEVNVAHYYMRRGAYVAAANRGRYVVENYPRTPATPEALVIMAKAYKVMELHELAADATRVLEVNFPNHPGLYELERIVVR